MSGGVSARWVRKRDDAMTYPEPAVLSILDRLDEELADLVRRRLRIAVLAQHNRIQLLLIPICHVVLYPYILLALFLLPILPWLPCLALPIQTLLLRLPFYCQIVTKLALLPLLTIASLEELTQHRLRVDAKRDLLHLHGLEQLGGLFCRLLCCELVLGDLVFQSLFPLVVGGTAGGLLLFYGVDLFLCCTTFFVLHACRRRDVSRSGLGCGEVVMMAYRRSCRPRSWAPWAVFWEACWRCIVVEDNSKVGCFVVCSS